MLRKLLKVITIIVYKDEKESDNKKIIIERKHVIFMKVFADNLKAESL